MTDATLKLLGAPHLLLDGVRVSVARKKALALLAYLTVSPVPHSRESLAALLWGDSDQQSAHAYLRNALWTLNKALGQTWALTDSGTVGVNPAYPLRVDVTEFTNLVHQALPDSAHHHTPLGLLSQAAALYTGEFMAGFNLPDCPEFDQWQTLTAESLQRTAHTLFKSWTAALSQAGQLTAAVDAAQRWVRLDPLHEPAHRALMRHYADVGESAAALRQYRELSRLLREELRAQPDPATVALYNALIAPALAPVPSETPEQPEVVLSPIAPAPDPLMGAGVRKLTQATFIIGRETERADLLTLLSDPLVRLITITGAGGMGKTRLSEQIGADAFNAGLFSDGAFFISLSPLCNPDAIAPTLVNALPFATPTGIDAEHILCDMLRERHSLLVIDNCEHVLEGVALFNRLLEAAPHVKILATSRERLTLRHERIYDLRGLPIPTEKEAESSPTVGLFVSHARQIAPDFALTPQNAADIARICRLVEGMPLAIELAAAWSPLLTPAQIATEIQRSIDFLATSTRDMPERHRSLRAVFASSWEQMSAEEQMALARLAVFRGGFTIEAASAVAGASLPSLLALVNKSLLKRGRAGRFEIHELLRQFADSCLTPDDKTDARDRHARYFAAHLQALLPRLLTAEQPIFMEVIQTEVDNLRAAVQHTMDVFDLPTLAQLVDPMGFLNTISTRYDDLGDLFLSAADALALRPQTDDVRVLTARLLVRSASVKRVFSHQSVIDGLTARAAALLEPYTERLDTALTWIDLGTLLRRPIFVSENSAKFIQYGLTLFRQIGHRWGIAYGLYQLGSTLHMQIHYAEGRVLLHEALTIFEELGQPLGIILCLDILSENYFTLGDYKAANEYLQRQVAPLRALGNRHQAAAIEQKIQSYHIKSSRLPSEAMLEKSLSLAREVGDRSGIAWTHYSYGWVKWLQTEYPDALSHLLTALEIFSVLGEEEGIIWTNIFAADCQRCLGNHAQFERHVARVREYLLERAFPWGEAGLEFILGDAALSNGDIDAAFTHYRTAVHLAHEVQSIMQTLRHLCGIAEIWIRRGRVVDGLTLCYFLIKHPAIWDDSLKRARMISAHAETSLPADFTLEMIQTRAERLTLEDIIAQLDS